MLEDWMRFDADKLRAANKWKSVAEIPGFPVGSFAEMRQAVADGRYYLSADQTAGHRVTALTSSRSSQVFSLFLTWMPFLVGGASLATALVTGRYLLILAAPIALLTMIIANPISPLRGPSTLAAWGALAAVFVFLLSGREAAAWLCASFVIPFHAIRAVYARGTLALQAAALTSETLFLYAWECNAVALRESSSGRLIGNWPTTTDTADAPVSRPGGTGDYLRLETFMDFDIRTGAG